MVVAAPVLPAACVVSASRIADRRMILASYRLARSSNGDFLETSGSQIDSLIFRIFAGAVDSFEWPAENRASERPASEHRRSNTHCKRSAKA
jgi:hypothetical protein